MAMRLLAFHGIGGNPGASRILTNIAELLRPGAQADDSPVGKVGSGDQECDDNYHRKSTNTCSHAFFGSAPQGNGSSKSSEGINDGRQKEASGPNSQVSHARNQIVAGGVKDDHNCDQAQNCDQRPQSHATLRRTAAFFSKPAQNPERCVQEDQNHREHKPASENDLGDREPRGDALYRLLSSAELNELALRVWGEQLNRGYGRWWAFFAVRTELCVRHRNKDDISFSYIADEEFAVGKLD